jgi:hypothetical protein
VRVVVMEAIEAVRTSPARRIGMCIDTVIAARTDLR